MNDLQVQKDICSAIKASDVEKVTELLGSDTERLNMPTPFGTWLHVAASKGELAIVRTLIELGADVNRIGGVYGGGALNEAASAGKVEVVKYLLSCGAELDVSSPGRNPFITLATTGMSDQPMNYSNEEGMYKSTELVLKLPSTWTLNQQWPLGWLRQIAHIPHLYDGWVEDLNKHL